MNPTLQEWMDRHQLFTATCQVQVSFMQHELTAALFKDVDECAQHPIRVVSTHCPRGSALPVYEITLADRTVLTLRNNYQDWKVSVDSPRAVNADFLDLFDHEEAHHFTINEGFPHDRVFDPYAKNRRRFTAKIGTNADLYAFAFILGHTLGLRHRC